MKKVLAFDLDDTLSVSKSPMSDSMAEVFSEMLEHFEVCIISGGRFEQFEEQVINRLHVESRLLDKLHMMPTCGTRYYRYNSSKKVWDMQYAEDLSAEQKLQIQEVLESSAKELGYWEEETAGDIIEDRQSQITFSALGQKATPEDKYAWDPTGEKKTALRDLAAQSLPGFEVRAGGSTSIDITRIGIDKAYGMQKLIEALDISKEDILFFGDKLQEGGNDYPVKAMGIDSLEVTEWEDTVARLETILQVIK